MAVGGRRVGAGMRVAVTGSRHGAPAGLVREVLSGLDPRPSVIIHGGCTGVDAEVDAVPREMGIVVEDYPADWKLHRRMAGRIRNEKMAQESKAEILLVFPGGAGTTDCAARFQERGIECRRVG